MVSEHAACALALLGGGRGVEGPVTVEDEVEPGHLWEYTLSFVLPLFKFFPFLLTPPFLFFPSLSFPFFLPLRGYWEYWEYWE